MTTGNDGLCVLAEEASEMPYSACCGMGQAIHESETIDELLQRVFRVVSAPARFADCLQMTLAIDAPFAFPAAIRALIDGRAVTAVGESALGNQYLFRRTERAVRSHLKRNPLSTIQDRIGSQTTKAMHVLAKFGFQNGCDGVWRLETKSGKVVKAIETYPALCKVKGSDRLRRDWLSRAFRSLRPKLSSERSDENDALMCALIARTFANNRDALCAPPSKPDHTFDPIEGWIWYPGLR